jgi:flagellin-like hook-associated protein FlgL
VDSGFYAACAGLISRTQALDLAANNLANTSTTNILNQTGISALAQANQMQQGVLSLLR